MPQVARGLGGGVCHGLTDTPPPRPPALPGRTAPMPPLSHEDLCSSCESYSFCSVKVSVAQSCETPWTVAHRTPLSMGFFRQGSWSG